MFYVYVKENPPKLIAEGNISSFLSSLHKNMLFPAKLPKELLSKLGLEPVTIRLVTNNNIEPHAMEYVHTVLGTPYQESNLWYIDSEEVIDQPLIDKEWKKVRATRDEYLIKTDWIENSTVVTEASKAKYRIYRQLLRNCINIAKYPNEVYFPCTPSLNKLYVNVAPDLTDNEVDLIKDYVPDNNTSLKWNMFLVAWSKTGFTLNRSYVNDLSTLIADVPLNLILTN